MSVLRDLALVVGGAIAALAIAGMCLAARDLLAHLGKQDLEIEALKAEGKERQCQIDELKQIIGGKRLSNLGIAITEELSSLETPGLAAVERLQKARGFLLQNLDEVEFAMRMLHERLGEIRNGGWHKDRLAHRDGRRR